MMKILAALIAVLMVGSIIVAIVRDDSSAVPPHAAAVARTNLARERGLAQLARTANVGCPRQIDAHTRLDEVRPSADSLEYFYTVTGIPDECLARGGAPLKAHLIQQTMQTPQERALYAHGARMVFTYRNSAGAVVVQFTITEADLLAPLTPRAP